MVLRRVMFGLQPSALNQAIKVLNYCSHNGDNSYRARWMSEANRTAVRKHFIWSVDEAVKLLDRTSDEEGFERGSFSSCIYWLIVGPHLNDPSHYVKPEGPERTCAATVASTRQNGGWCCGLLVGRGPAGV